MNPGTKFLRFFISSTFHREPSGGESAGKRNGKRRSLKFLAGAVPMGIEGLKAEVDLWRPLYFELTAGSVGIRVLNPLPTLRLAGAVPHRKDEEFFGSDFVDDPIAISADQSAANLVARDFRDARKDFGMDSGDLEDRFDLVNEGQSRSLAFLLEIGRGFLNLVRCPSSPADPAGHLDRAWRTRA
jgi:hypothetical protein